MKNIFFFFVMIIAALGFVSCSEKPSEDTSKTLEKKVTSTEQPVKQEEKTPVKEEVSVKTVEQTPATKEVKQLQVPADATEVKMKIKAKEKDGLVKAKVSISHNMLTYDQAKKKGLEANFITHITASVGEKIVYDASTSQFLSKNPLVKFSFNGKKGEVLKIVYTQLKGEVFYATKEIK